jgi:hypothetical protein
MKLTPDLIERSESRLSPLKDRELDLRGRKIPAIENLGVTRVSGKMAEGEDQEEGGRLTYERLSSSGSK